MPGTVTDFNWTYRLPATLESLSKDDALIEKIKSIVAVHNGGTK